MKKIFYLGMAVIFLASCQSNQKQKAAENAADSIAASVDSTLADTSAAEDVVNKKLMESYAGTLPCADCEGIKTELSVYSDNTYVLKETYLGKGDGKPFESTGKLNTERGYEKDNDATVYVLDYDKPGEERYFVRFTGKDKKLVMLDKQRKMIKTKLNYSLDKQ